MKSSVNKMLCFALCVIFSLNLFGAQMAEAEPLFHEKLIKFVEKVLANPYKQDWIQDDYCSKSILRVKKGKLPVKLPFKPEILDSHPLLAAYRLIDRVKVSYNIDPTEPENFEEFLELHKLFIGTTLESDLIERLIYGMLARRIAIKETFKLHKYLDQLGKIFPTRQYIPLNKRVLEVMIFSQALENLAAEKELITQLNSKDYPFPVLPDELFWYAKAMFKLGRTDLAREAIERYLNQCFYRSRALNSDDDLSFLYENVERPISSIPPTPEEHAFKSITGGIFGTNGYENGMPVHMTYLKTIFKPSGNKYAGKESQIPVDMIDFLIEQAKVSPELDFVPEFISKDGFYLVLYPYEGELMAFMGGMGVNCEFSYFYAMVDGRFRMLDTPEANYGMNMVLQESKILNNNHAGEIGYPDGENPIVEILKFSKPSENTEFKFSFPPEFSQGGILTKGSDHKTWLPDQKAMFKAVQYTWDSRKKGYSKDPYSIINFNMQSSNTKIEQDRMLAILKENAEEAISALEKFTGAKFDSCRVSNFSGHSFESGSLPKLNRLNGWAAIKGLPSWSSQREFFRLYQTLNLNLPANGQVNLPLKVGGSFGDIGLSGYWFPEQKMLVVANFQMDLNSLPGRNLSEALGLPKVDQKISVKSMNPFYISNYSMDFDSKEKLPESWAPAFEKILPKEYQSGSHKRKMFFFVQKNGEPAEFKIVTDPDS